MKIMATTSTDYNKKSPTFKGDQVLTLGRKIPQGTKQKLINAIKNNFGEGLITKTYEYMGKEHTCKTFVGYNPKNPGRKNSPIRQIIFANGNDRKLENATNHEQSYAKFCNVDDAIQGRLEEILEHYGIDPKMVLKQSSNAGDIIQDGDKISVKTNPKGKNGYLAPQTWYDYKKVGDSFQYQGVKEVIQHG
jgi:hypothetical protein